jgi:hypothetical protein
MSGAEPTPPEPLPSEVHARARAVGHWVWTERRVFECFGDWAGSTPEPAAAVCFGEMSRRHGWHAELLADRLPELASVDAESLVVASGPATESFLESLAEDGEASTVGRLSAAYRVLLPLLVTQYRSALATVSEVAEPSLGRWLGIVLRDDLEEWSRGQALLQAALCDELSVRAAAARQLELDLLALRTEQLAR